MVLYQHTAYAPWYAYGPVLHPESQTSFGHQDAMYRNSEIRAAFSFDLKSRCCTRTLGPGCHPSRDCPRHTLTDLTTSKAIDDAISDTGRGNVSLAPHPANEGYPKAKVKTYR